MFPERRILSLALPLSFAVLASCTGRVGDEPSPSASSAEDGAPTPSDPYPPFPYANETQRQAFAAFLACAADHGVRYRGPFADSQGKGVLFGPVEGEKISRARQSRVSARCPQGMVGLFATPGGHVAEALFERSLDRFVRCMRSHGVEDLPLPRFTGDDPYAALDALPFDWASASFTEAARRCIDPLQAYVFSG